MTKHMKLVVASLLILSACNEATADAKSTDVTETKPLTRSECMAKEIKDDKIACLKSLTAMRQKNLTRQQEQLTEKKKEIQELEKENEALLREFEKDVLDED